METYIAVSSDLGDRAIYGIGPTRAEAVKDAGNTGEVELHTYLASDRLSAFLREFGKGQPGVFVVDEDGAGLDSAVHYLQEEKLPKL